MKVAIFSETFLPKWDGVANTVCRLLEHLQREGHEVLMYAPEGAPESYAGARIISLPSYPLPWYTDLRLVAPRKGMAAEVLDFLPDVVHVVNPALMGLLGMRRARKVGAPVVASYHTDLPGYTLKYGLSMFNDPLWSYFRWVHNQADLNVCPSEFTRRQLVERGFERVEIWGRGVDTDRFSPDHRTLEWRERLTDGNPRDPLLVYAGRLAIEKRVDVIRPVLDAFPGVRLAVVGDGPLKGELQDLFAGTKTVFTGFLTGLDLSRAYAAGDVFVFPGENETFGNVVLEAMASGMPVVAARTGGPVDHVHEGEDGFLFPPGDSGALIGCLRWILADTGVKRRMAGRARHYARAQTWQGIMGGLVERYETLASVNLMEAVG